MLPTAAKLTAPMLTGRLRGRLLAAEGGLVVQAVAAQVNTQVVTCQTGVTHRTPTRTLTCSEAPLGMGLLVRLRQR